MVAHKDLQSGFLLELATGIGQLDFDPKVHGQSFYRPLPFGKASFHVAFIKHATDLDITADVAVRVDAVEELVNEDNPNLSKAERQKTFTLGAELGNLSQGAQRRWRLSSMTDCRTVSAAILSSAREIAVPYVTNFSDLERIFQVLSRNDPSSWLHSPIHGERCKRAIALAHILNKAEALDALIKLDEEFLRQRKDFGLSSFVSLAKKIGAPDTRYTA